MHFFCLVLQLLTWHLLFVATSVLLAYLAHGMPLCIPLPSEWPTADPCKQHRVESLVFIHAATLWLLTQSIQQATTDRQGLYSVIFSCFLLSCVYVVYACVYLFVHGCTCPYVHVWRPQVMLNVFYDSPTHFFFFLKEGLSPNLELANRLDRLTSKSLGYTCPEKGWVRHT